MPLLPGARVGSYEIVAPVGAGGMGEVYRARDNRLGRDAALKLLPDDLANDPERRARFEREARTLAGFNHPSIVTIFGVEEVGGENVIAMEWIDGPTLADIIPKGGLSLERLLRIATQVTNAVAAAHRHGIVHRDLKPANMMLTARDRVKVLDFGLAKERLAGDGQAETLLCHASDHDRRTHCWHCGLHVSRASRGAKRRRALRHLSRSAWCCPKWPSASGHSRVTRAFRSSRRY